MDAGISKQSAARNLQLHKEVAERDGRFECEAIVPALYC